MFKVRRLGKRKAHRVYQVYHNEYRVNGNKIVDTYFLIYDTRDGWVWVDAEFYVPVKGLFGREG